ncbi:Diaminopimelate epimerase-like protein, partial [Exidia glandulosa HHB12029]
YTVLDAFTSHVFAGNPACVIVLPRGLVLPEATMQLIGREFNLSETAFVEFTDEPTTFGLRWFTPALEVPLCGHATLAAAQVLFSTTLAESSRIVFQTRWSGNLICTRTENGKIEMEFPAGVVEAVDDTLRAKAVEAVRHALGLETAPLVNFVGRTPGASFDRFILIHIDDNIDLASAKVDPSILVHLNPPCRTIVLTNSPPNGAKHFVSRVFAIAAGIPEDPVTGSAHSILTPYWSQKLGINGELNARQVSPRGGDLDVSWVREDGASGRVKMRGEAVVAAKGTLYVPS